MNNGKKIICPDCGTAVVEVRDGEPFIRGRIYKFDKTNGEPFVKCRGSISREKQCKAIVYIPKNLVLEMMMLEEVLA